MRIKSLQVHGFKSFVDRTVFVFRDGVTAVVGPNGCGKSNVVDAIRWVMGEQSAKRLRGKGMDDVIFAGSETRPPIGMAEVLLTFDNSDGLGPANYAAYTEIEICRRLYRSGESEYLINKAATRLKDVQDFFRDTGIGAKGYTIVEQGKVAEIVSAKADERRILIEEAAGITKYKARRREAEGKIRSTEQNLQRVEDVLHEIKRQISTLERQAKQAARYKRLKETQRILELSLASDDRRDLLEAVDQARGQMGELKDVVTTLTTQLAERELAAEEKRIAVTEAEKAVSRGAEQLYALRSEIKNIEGQIELGRRECENIDESAEGRSQEAAQLREQLAQAERDGEQARSELEQLEEAVVNQQVTVDRAEAERNDAGERLRSCERERDEANAALVDVLTSIARGEDRVSAVADRRAEIDQRLRSADRDYEVQQTVVREAGNEQDNLEHGLRNLLTERDRFQDQLIDVMRQHEHAGETLRESSESLRELRERFEARNARLASLREVVEANEEIGAGTRHLMSKGDEAKQKYGLLGVVRELLDVDGDVALAVDAVLGDRAEAIVASRSGGAIEALQALRSESAGRGVLLVQPAQSAANLGIVPLGQRLLERIQARPGHEEIAHALLGDVYLVDSLREAFDVYGQGRLPATFVTRSGDIATPDGIVRGGSDGGASGSFTRVREVNDLEAEVRSLEAQVRASESAHTSAESNLEATAQELDNIRNRHHTAALAMANHEKDLERTAERVKALGEAQQSRGAERADLLAELEALTEEQTRLEQQLGTARDDRTQRQTALDALGLKLGSTGRELSRLESRVTELRVAHNARLENRDRLSETVERAANSCRETAEWIERREREIETGAERKSELEAQQVQLNETLAIQLEAEEVARQRSDDLRDAYETKAAELRAIDDTVRELRGELTGSQEHAAGAELALRESEMRLEHQAENIRERWSIDITSWALPEIPEKPATEAAKPASNESADSNASDDGASAGQSAEAEVAARLQGLAAADDGEGGETDGPQTASEAQSLYREARRNAELARAPREERESTLEGLRKSLQALGDVNLGAIEEHEELAERYRFLSEQRGDLLETIETLREAIARINRTSRKRFRETFEAVSKRFSENFPRLFGGGKASLQLTEAEDVLDAGIDIMAMPPGKRLQNVNLLSGGEKTMTALALLVAVFQVRPSPFFLLDEVDAALDDANVGRFNQLITEMAGDSQFLVITHNKRTIEVADVLYGVTMEQKGVSKLVGVELTG